jgi:hypothetical protein
MAYRELQPLIKKAPSFRGVMSTTRCVWKGPASALANKGEGWWRINGRPPQTSDAQPSLLLGPVFPGCHRKRVITPP